MKHILPVAAFVWCMASVAYADVHVIDGDTIDLGATRYRLDGIDAPEHGQKCAAKQGEWDCGNEATSAMFDLVDGKDIRCKALGDDGRNRVIAKCTADGRDIGGELVRTGFAWAFTKYSTAYVAQEAEARAAGLGIWQAPTIPAWQYRAEKWKSAEQVAPRGCPIKGNITSNGYIYHAPWSPWYDRTRVHEAKGERWFCSEEEAVAAGFRAPRWH